MYQSQFPRNAQAQPAPALLGILSKAALGRFVLGRAPSTVAAAQPSCPYRPLHVMDNGMAFFGTAPATLSNSAMTQAAVVPSYPQARTTADQGDVAAVPSVDSFEKAAIVRDFTSGKQDSIPQAQAGAAEQSPIAAVHTDSIAREAYQAADSSPAKPKPLADASVKAASAAADSLPARVVECR